MITANVSQVARLSADFSRANREGRLRILNETQRIAFDLVGYIKRSKLQGQVLHHRSGNLSSRVTQRTEVRNDTIYSLVGVFSGVPYARIHEYGSRAQQSVKAHQRTIKTVFGRDIDPITVEVSGFTRQMNMPERSYLRSSLSDKREEILGRLSRAASNVMGGAK